MNSKLQNLFNIIERSKINKLKYIELTRDNKNKKDIENFDTALENYKIIIELGYSFCYIPPNGMNGYCNEIKIRWD